MTSTLRTVGRPIPRVDAISLATARARFTDDVALPSLLHAHILRSPHAHARIKRLNATPARALHGVVAVLTHDEMPALAVETDVAEPSVVRFAGERVAVVAAEDPELASRACEAIDVQYEVLEPVLDIERALEHGPCAAEVTASIGDVDRALADADRVIEATYSAPFAASVPVETHICLTWLDEQHRLVIHTSTQAPFHVRRVVAERLGLPLHRVRVIVPRVGGGGGKQDVLVEDVCAMLTLRTGRPVRLEHTREEELTIVSSRRAHRIHIRSGLADGQLVALDVDWIENGGAHAAHCKASLQRAGMLALSLYRCPHVRYRARAVRTHLPVSVGLADDVAPHLLFALESHVDEAAAALGEDPLEFRRRHHVREGDSLGFLAQLADVETPPQLRSCGLAQAMRAGAKELGGRGRTKNAHGPTRTGRGVALVLHGSPMPRMDRSAAIIKMNEDGSFNLMIGVCDAGTGADTLFCQIAAETLAVPIDRILLHDVDTDTSPMESGLASSSVTSVSGRAVQKAAEQIRGQLIQVASRVLGDDPSLLRIEDAQVWGPGGRSARYEDLFLHSLGSEGPFPIMGVASDVATVEISLSFAAVFAEVEVNVETGVVRVKRLVQAVDCGRVLNPQIAEAQATAGALLSISHALCDQMPFDHAGRPIWRRLRELHGPRATDVPDMKTLFVPTEDPAGPFGAKAIGDMPLSGAGPAIANAIAQALGVRLRELPITPERVLAAIDTARPGS